MFSLNIFLRSFGFLYLQNMSNVDLGDIFYALAIKSYENSGKKDLIRTIKKVCQISEIITREAAQNFKY